MFDLHGIGDLLRVPLLSCSIGLLLSSLLCSFAHSVVVDESINKKEESKEVKRQEKVYKNGMFDKFNFNKIVAEIILL